VTPPRVAFDVVGVRVFGEDRPFTSGRGPG
jgi:hypothetical protein